MSGGFWQYKDEDLRYEIFKQTDNPFEDRTISGLVNDVFKLLHDFDWYKSSDTGIEDWNASRAKFKMKWLKIKEVSRKRCIFCKHFRSPDRCLNSIGIRVLMPKYNECENFDERVKKGRNK